MSSRFPCLLVAILIGFFSAFSQDHPISRKKPAPDVKTENKAKSENRKPKDRTVARQPGGDGDGKTGTGQTVSQLSDSDLWKKATDCLEEKDYECALISFRELANRGDAPAQYNLGMLYYDGNGVARDSKEAAEWFRKAADRGYDKGQYGLGMCYYFGEGVPKDYNEAVRLLRKAADQGNASAQYNLGLMFFNGEGVEQNYAMAAEWFRKAAEQDQAMAQFNLGTCYCEGIGVPLNKAVGIEWYKKAARQGHGRARNILEGLGETWE